MDSGEKTGLVLSIKRGIYEVEADGATVKCRAATGVRKKEGRILAGDRVIFSENGIDGGFITSLLERKNSFVRPPVANIDLMAIAVSPREPAPYFYNIDLLSVIAEKSGAECAVIITKSDLGDGDKIREIYQRTAITVVETCAHDGIGIDSAKALLSGKVCVLCGASGVGKSSLLNAMYPDLNTLTGELSERIQRGKNTTRVTELFPLEGGTYIADSPGFTAVDTELYCTIEHGELYKYFPEFAEYVGLCRYNDCTHTKETECAIANAVKNGLISESRFNSYNKLYQELKNINRYK